LSLRSLATNQKTPEAAPAPLAAEPDSLDDLLRAETNARPAGASPATNEPAPNMTRDTEVSKIISPEDAAGSQVTIIRGSERTSVQFGPSNMEPKREP